MPLSNFEVPYRFYTTRPLFSYSIFVKHINNFIRSEATIIIIVSIHGNKTAIFPVLTERGYVLRDHVAVQFSDLLNSPINRSPRRLHLSEKKELSLIKRANGTRSLQVEVSVTS